MTISVPGLEILKESAGKGGSAVVHKARVIETGNGLPKAGEFVAVKQYYESILQHANQDERIAQERSVGSSIKHPSIVRVYDWPPLSGGQQPTCLVMEWIDGPTLDVWCRELRKNAAWDRIREVSLNIVNAVAELHANGVLHRDIKPENVMVEDDKAKLMDIGVAEVTGDNEHTLHTAVKDFVGSVRFASPQFIMGERFEVKDDVYSIGTTLFVVLTGRVPYADVERKTVLPIEVTRRPPEVGKLRDNVPAALKVVLQGCVHHSRDRRPTLEQLRDALIKDGGSDYVESELQRQATESGYTVIQLDSKGAGFYADLGDETPEIGRDYRVVRKAKGVKVPSLNTEVEPEKWIASAELRHVHQNVGHFKLTTRVWIPGKPHGLLAGIQAQGQWQDRDVKSEDVAIGDIVAREPADY